MADQEILLYRCKCGFTDPDKTAFNKHLLAGGSKDGKGVHKSEGRVNPQTGEVVMPNWDARSKEQKEASTYGLKKKTQNDAGAARQTEIIMDATQLKFVPRVLSCSFTPIMMAGLMASQNIWGWRRDMPWENWLDTVIIHFFRDRGVELGIYSVKNPEEHQQIQEENARLIAEEEKKETANVN